MPTNVGTLDINTLLAVKFVSAAQYGMDTIQKVLAADIAAHNVLVQDLVGELCEMSTDRQRIYGTSTEGEMIEVDEYGRGPTQEVQPGATCGFPLRLFQYAIGWTDKWFEVHTPADMAIAVQNAEKAHLKAIQKQVKQALFGSANYDFVDFLIDKITLNVKRLVNADGAGIPDGPNAEKFDGATHTHYDAVAALAATPLLALINDVVEHGYGGRVRIAINKADEAAVSALAGFKAYQDPRIVYRVTDTPGQTLDISRLDNRAIGLFGAAEVWVKPWMPANYAFAWDAGSPNKPLVFRQRSASGLQGLRIAARLSAFPLNSEYMESEFGLGVWNRTNGAVLYFGGVAYADPVF